MITSDVIQSVALGGRSFPYKTTYSDNGLIMKEVTVPAAKTGQLTTRTDNDTGELTMTAGHGITTGQRLDVYWIENGVQGCRRGMIVGTVAGNAVPIDLGAGDNLPANLTNVTAMVPIEEPVAMTGNSVRVLATTSSKFGQIVFADSGNVELHSTKMGGAAGTEQSALWWDTNGVTNPLAGDTVAKVFFSHKDSDNSAIMTFAALVQ